MPNLSISRELLAALQKFPVKTTFSVAELTQAYMAEPGDVHTSKKAARQFVYRNMTRLLKNGTLEQVRNGRRWPSYQLSTAVVSKAASSVPPTTTVVPKAIAGERFEKLRERLNLHKVEMLTAMGEAEEYNSICVELPEMRSEVQERYNQARDRCSKLLGKVKALESLLAQSPN